MVSTKDIIQTLTEETAQKLNTTLRHWNAAAAHDDSGHHIVLISTKNPEDTEKRTLLLDTLDKNDDDTDLTRYCWNYWNSTRAQWHVSDLTSDADTNAVIDFLIRHLDAEA